MSVGIRERLDRQPVTGYRLDPLTPDEVASWDQLISGHTSCELFHRNAWLDHLAAGRGVDIAKWAIRSGNRTLGYFCGGLIRLGPFLILGSPLRSWGTNVMGPVADVDIDQTKLLAALDDLASAKRLAMIELEHPRLSPRALEAAGFECLHDWTYVVALHPAEPDAMWRALESTCRNRIRKAMAAGLVIEDTDDPAVVNEYYDFYSDLLARKGRRPSFSRETPIQLFANLKKADCLFAVRVKDPAGRLLAVGLFPHDDRTVYFWSGASREDAHPLCPNDFLQWGVMRLAASRGLRLYNMSGYGRFKRKFGGTLIELARWHKCYWRTARLARRAYRVWFDTLGTRSLWPPRRARKAERLATISQRPSFRLSDIYRAPLHDFPIRDEILYQYLKLSNDMDVLEIGPGSGFTAFRLARQVRSLTLVDIASASISHLSAALKTLHNLDFVCADVCQPGLARLIGRTFDAVYAIEVFELLPDPETCLKNLGEVLRPGGRLLLQFPNYPPALSPGLTHFCAKAELDRLMKRAGFSSWSVFALRLRPHARLVFEYLHEKPIRAYRRRRSRSAQGRPLIYDESWAFQHAKSLEPFKYAMHTAWALMSGIMRFGGPAFGHSPVDNDILNRNLLVRARR